MTATSPSDEALEVLHGAISVLNRRTRDIELHRTLGERVGIQLDGPYYSTLGRIAAHPDPTLSELADLLGLELSTVSRRVKALESRGWVERRANRADGRSFRLRLTPEGQAASAALEQSWRAMLVEILDRWSPEEITSFVESFSRFAQDVEEYALRVRAR